MFERFTDRARMTVTDAQVVARRLGHGKIGTEHLLLGLLEGDGVAARVLGGLGITGGQASLLIAIKGAPGIGVNELAGRERVSPPAMTGAARWAVATPRRWARSASTWRRSGGVSRRRSARAPCSGGPAAAAAATGACRCSAATSRSRPGPRRCSS